ncbi:MAG: restriction endonuclease subunit S [Magnetococcales bacterium]|nr:restriction endonuclease subunit S [Magnetococcales bacterium]
MKKWPTVPLGEVLRYRKDFTIIDDTQQYKRCRVQLHAKGVVLRDLTSGADIKTKRQQVCRTGDFLVAEIDAKMGGFGLVPESLNGAVVSSHYFLFESDDTCLDKRYLDHYCHARRFRNQVEAQGSTNYAAIRPVDVLNYSIPLPSLAEQQALVARLDALAEKTRQVEAHLDAVERDAEHLLALRFRDAIAGAPLRALAEVAPAVRRSVEIDITQHYREIGARSFGKGLFVKPDFDGAEATWQKPVWIKAGDLVLSNIKAWEGAIAIAGQEHEGCIASHRYITCTPDTTISIIGFLAYYLLSEEGLEKVGFASPGTADRNRTLNLTNLGKISVPIPPLSIQRTFEQLQAEIAALKAKHAAIRAANAALLPATLERVFAETA